MSEESLKCPVCGTPFSPGQPRCENLNCGWQLQSAPVLGRLTAEQVQDFQRRLEQARQEYRRKIEKQEEIKHLVREALERLAQNDLLGAQECCRRALMLAQSRTELVGVIQALNAHQEKRLHSMPPLVAITPENAARIEQIGHIGIGDLRKIAFSPDRRLLAVAGNNIIHLYDIEDLREVGFIEAYGVEDFSFSPDGTLMATASRYRIVQLWNVSDGSLLSTLEGHRGVVFSVFFSPDGTMLVSKTSKTIRIWGVKGAFSGTIHQRAKNSLARIPINLRNVKYIEKVGQLSIDSIEEYLIFSPDGEIMASWSEDIFRSDNNIQLWRTADNRLLRTLEGHTSRVRSVVFSPDGSLLASASDDKTVRLWRAADGAPLYTLEETTDSVWRLGFSPDGKWLALHFSNNTLVIWQISDDAGLRTTVGHYYNVKRFTFSPQGALLATVCSDGKICLWDVIENRLLHSFEAHKGNIIGVLFSPSGTRLVSMTSKTVRLWGVR